MSAVIEMAIIANRITALAPQLRIELVAALGEFLDTVKERDTDGLTADDYPNLQALYDVLTTPPYQPDPRD